MEIPSKAIFNLLPLPHRKDGDRKYMAGESVTEETKHAGTSHT